MTDSTVSLISFVLTLMVFSYLLGDLPLVRILYRTAIYIFVGMSAAFSAIVTYEGVILPYMSDIQDSATSWTALGSQADSLIFYAAALFGLLLLLKPIASLAWLTNSLFAVVIVVGAATAVVGALGGTLFPLVDATVSLPPNFASNVDSLLDTLLIFLGTVTALFYFQFQMRRSADASRLGSGLGRGLRTLGKVFIVTALGAIYATTMLSTLTILIDRVAFLIRFGG